MPLDKIIAGHNEVMLHGNAFNSNSSSTQSVERNLDLLYIHQKCSVIHHSEMNRSETLNEIVFIVTVEVGPHKYTSN